MSEGPRPVPFVAVSFQLVGAGLILIGVFSPWIQSHALFLTVPVRGTETDYGRLFPAIALAVFGILAYEWSLGWRKWAHGVILLLGMIALTVAVLYGVQVTQRVHRIAETPPNHPPAPLVLSRQAAFSAEFDIGYYATLCGAGSMLVGAVMGLRQAPHQGA